MGLLETLRGRMGLPTIEGRYHANGNGQKALGGRSGVSIVPGVSFFSPDGTRSIFQLGSTSSQVERVTQQTAYAAAAYAYVAINYRASKLAEAPLQVSEIDRESGSEEWLPDHPLAEFLDTPSPDFTMAELVERTQIYRDITGSALWVKQGDTLGRPGRLSVFSGDEFTIESKGDRLRGLFRIETDGPDREFAPEQVVYFEETNPFDWHSGLSRVDVALANLNLAKKVQHTIRTILENAIMPGGVVSPHQDWQPSDEEWEAYKAAIDAHARKDNKGKTLILLGGSTFSASAMPLTSLVPDEIMNRVEATIAAVFGIPAVVLQYLVGLQNSPWSQMSEARRMAYEDTIEPLWRDYERRITRQLLWAPMSPGGRPVETDRDRTIKFDTTNIRALQPDKQRLTDIATKWAPFASFNEMRSLVGLEPDDDPAADEMPWQRTPVVPEGMDEDEDEEQDIELEKRGGHVWSVKERSGSRVDVARLRWQVFDMGLKSEEIQWEMAAAAQLQNDRQKVVRAARALLKDQKAVDRDSVNAFLQDLDDILDIERDWLPLTKRLISATGRRGVSAIATALGIAFDVLEPGLSAYVEREAAFLVKSISETTRASIQRALRAGLEAGEGVNDIATRIRQVGAFAKSRAELIARTETTRVTNGAQRETLEDFAARTGATVTKTWLTAGDDRVRPEHDALQGTTIDIAATFPNGLKEPGEPGCRCTLIYDVVGA